PARLGAARSARFDRLPRAARSDCGHDGTSMAAGRALQPSHRRDAAKLSDDADRTAENEHPASQSLGSGPAKTPTHVRRTGRPGSGLPARARRRARDSRAPSLPTCRMTPRVSVIMPVHNGLPFLRAALDSLYAQTFGDFEIIVVDDGSTDGTWDMLRNERDRRLRLTKNYVRGLGAALNHGLRFARGEFI